MAANPVALRSRPRLITLLSLLLAAIVSGCGGTRVMSSQKTIVHDDRIYNVSVVREVQGIRQVILLNAELRDPTRIDDRARRDLFDRYDEVRVGITVMFDDNNLVYFNRMVDSRLELD